MSHIKGGLLDQHRLLRAIIKDERRALSHVMVAAEIIDRYWGKFGNGRASVRLLKDVTGLSNQTIIEATRDLTEWGYFERRLGTGTRPTEYIPIWASVLADQNATADDPSVLVEQNACVLVEQNANPASVLAEQNETYLQEDGLRPGLPEGRNINTPAAPTAPLSACLSAADARAAVDPFERFWSTYPRRYQKPKTKAAWAKASPDADKAERIIIAAGLWAEHYAAHPVDKKWIPAPANWLAGERYDEDLPDVYVDAKQAAIAKKKATKPTKPKAVPAADNDNENDEPEGLDQPTKPRWNEYVVEVADVDDPDRFGNTYLKLKMRGTDGLLRPKTICLEHKQATTQDEGQKVFQRLVESADVDDVKDSSVLIGRKVWLDADDRFIKNPEPPALTERAFWGPNVDYDWKPPEKPPRPPVRPFLERVRMSPWAGRPDYDDETHAAAKAYAARCTDEEDAA